MVITSTVDQTVDYLISKFKHKLNFYRINTDKLQNYQIKVTTSGVIINGPIGEITADYIDAVYYRKPMLPDMTLYDYKFHSLMQRDILTLIEGIAEISGKVILTKPSILKRAENKVIQLHFASRLGFVIPASLITNDCTDASSFCNNQTSIVKPLSVGRILELQKINYIQTNIVDQAIPIQNLEIAPSYFQKYVDKDEEYRVTIVGRSVFTVKIQSSDKVDWRRTTAKVHYTKASIPNTLVNQCLDLMKLLDINYGAFDFILKDGVYYFLEVNPNGQWLWLEQALSLNISSAIIDHLLGGNTIYE
ncbi:hypothetical protein [Paenibacillus sp. FSL R7-0026]|uniref:hypothetical protein n=1 Tax=Paenibacillus sp. FSL R7-0026 TaxID=2921668 RepID=UPI0030F4D4D3